MAKKKKTAPKEPVKKGFPVKRVIAAALAVLVLAGIITAAVIVSNINNAKYVLRNTQWVPQAARNASGDEVDIREVYAVRYTEYQGSLTFDEKDGFELWLQPGDAADGTHSGKYEIKGNTANVTFDDGTATTFYLSGTNGDISMIELNYDDYTVAFVKKQTE